MAGMTRSNRYAASPGKAPVAKGDPFGSSTTSIKTERGGSTKRRAARPPRSGRKR